MGRTYRLSNGWSRGPAADHAQWILAPDDSGRLYDEAVGPKGASRPIRNGLIRRPDEWNDPALDAVILIVDALAAVDKTKRRIDAGNYPRATHTNALDGYEHWLDAQAVADRCGVPVTRVRSWRKRGVGPLHSQFGSHVRWDPRSVDDYARLLDTKRDRGTHPARPPAPTGPWHIVRDGQIGATYWTGTRWTPDPTVAKVYRQLPVAASLARGLKAQLRPTD